MEIGEIGVTMVVAQPTAMVEYEQDTDTATTLYHHMEGEHAMEQVRWYKRATLTSVQVGGLD